MPTRLERPEISSFINTWRQGEPLQVVQEIASLQLETNRIPDPYSFVVAANGELISPTARCRVKDVVEDKTGHLGQLEYQAVLAIERWAADSNEGSVVWVSPPYSGIYPTSKIVVSQIEYQDGAKRLFNRAIILDFDEKGCLRFAQDLAQLSQNRPLLLHLDQVRATPLILNTHGNSWIYILQKFINDPILWESIRNGEDQSAKKEAIKQATIVQQTLFAVSGSDDLDSVRAAVVRILGEGPGSCPVLFKTAFQVFSENSLLIGGGIETSDPDYCRSCPVCGKEINCIVRIGGSCPNCGEIKRCG
ncbi:hypothetical protein KKE78_04555 [Patescibacteria group bacterium]|nr:hypothetical protein [Patescibacteria group bacterium]